MLIAVATPVYHAEETMIPVANPIHVSDQYEMSNLTMPADLASENTTITPTVLEDRLDEVAEKSTMAESTSAKDDSHLSMTIPANRA